MLWARMVAYVSGTVNQELLLRDEYLGAENRILKGQIKGCQNDSLASEEPELECICGALGEIGERGVPLEAHPIRRVSAATSFAAIHCALP
jgi:putative transposase